MIADLIPAEPVMRLWGLICLGLIGGILATVLLLSHALDYLARRRPAAYPPAIPALVPLSPGSVRGMGGIAIGLHRNHLASNTVIVGAGGERGKQTEGS